MDAMLFCSVLLKRTVAESVVFETLTRMAVYRCGAQAMLRILVQWNFWGVKIAVSQSIISSFVFHLSLFYSKKISQPPPGGLLDSISNIFGYVAVRSPVLVSGGLDCPCCD